MSTINSTRIIALLPLRDFENTPKSVQKAHRFFNIGYLIFTILLMVLLPTTQLKGFRSVHDFGDLMLWMFVPLAVMWAIGYQLQLLQSRDECNQPNPNTPVICPIKPTKDDTLPVRSTESKGPGRPACAQFDPRVGPLNNETARAALDEFMGEYADGELKATDGRYIIDALRAYPHYFTNGDNSLESLASWVFERYRVKFRPLLKSGISMTTVNANRLDEDKAKLVKDKLNNKYIQISRKKKKE